MESNRENLGEYEVQYPDVTSTSDFINKRTIRSLNINAAHFDQYFQRRILPIRRPLFPNPSDVPRPNTVANACINRKEYVFMPFECF